MQTRMIFEELKRVLSKKIVLVILSLTFLNCFLFGYIQINSSKSGDFWGERKKQEEIILSCEDKEWETCITDLKESQKLIKQKTDDSFNALNEKEKKVASIATSNVLNKIIYLNDYHQYIENVIDNAENLQRYSIFTDQSSYSSADIEKTKKDYSAMLNVNTYLCNDSAVTAICSYTYIFYFCAGIMIILMFKMLEERDNGMWALIHSTKRGRINLAIVRTIIFAVVSFLIVFINYLLINVISFCMHGGFESIFEPIQNISMFQDFTYIFSAGQYMVFSLVYVWIVLLSLSLIIWLLFVLFRNRNLTIILVSIIAGVEFMLYTKIEAQSVYHLLREVNVVNILSIHEFLATYNNVQFMGFIYSMQELTAISLIVIGAAVSVLSIIIFQFLKPQGGKGLFKKLTTLIVVKYQKIFTKTPLINKEVHKLVFTSKGIWIIVIMTVFAAYFTGIGKVAYTDTALEKDAIYIEHGGKDYEFIEQSIEKAHNDYANILKKAEALSVKYENGKASLADITLIAGDVSHYAQVLGYYEEFETKIDYLNEIQQKYGAEGFLISDRGYEQIFGGYSKGREVVMMILLVIAINMIISKTILLEYQSGMNIIVKSTQKGREWLVKKKIIASIILVILLYLIVYGIDFTVMIKQFGLPHLNAPLISLTFMESSHLTISILSWLVIRQIVRAVFCIIVMALAFVLSGIFGKKRITSYIPFTIIAEIIIVILLFGNVIW